MSGPVAVGLLLGAAADRTWGDPRRWHPVAGFGRLMQRVEARLWSDDRRAGVAHAAVGIVIGAGPIWWLDRRLRDRPVARTALTAGVTWAALGGRSLTATGRQLGRHVAIGDLDGARALAPSLVGRDPATLDADGLVRAALESVAENTSDAVVGPFAWGALLGAPGVALHRAVNTMDAMVGHRSPRYERYGWAAARADDLAGWPAARLAALLTVVAAPSVVRAAPATADGDRPARAPATADSGDQPARDVGDRTRRAADPAQRATAAAWRAWRRDGASHPSPNAGQVEAAFAGALGVRLGGRNVYGERVEERPTLGDGPHARTPDPVDLERAALLSTRVGVLAALVAAGAALAVGAGPGRRLDVGGRGVAVDRAGPPRRRPAPRA